MFEPVHGSAPDIAGKGIANPIASIWSVSQLLEFLGYDHWSGKVLQSIREMLTERDNLTPDLGGKATTEQLGDRLREILISK